MIVSIVSANDVPFNAFDEWDDALEFVREKQAEEHNKMKNIPKHEMIDYRIYQLMVNKKK